MEGGQEKIYVGRAVSKKTRYVLYSGGGEKNNGKSGYVTGQGDLDFRAQGYVPEDHVNTAYNSECEIS